MKIFAKFDEIPSMNFQDIKETKRYGHSFVRSFVRTDGRTDNVKTVYPPTNIVCGGYKNVRILLTFFQQKITSVCDNVVGIYLRDDIQTMLLG